jgi:hypothetical protein
LRKTYIIFMYGYTHGYETVTKPPFQNGKAISWIFKKLVKWVDKTSEEVIFGQKMCTSPAIGHWKLRFQAFYRLPPPSFDGKTRSNKNNPHFKAVLIVKYFTFTTLLAGTYQQNCIHTLYISKIISIAPFSARRVLHAS